MQVNRQLLLAGTISAGAIGILASGAIAQNRATDHCLQTKSHPELEITSPT